MTDAHTLIGAYLVDAVDDIERAEVERHLTECADCAEEARSLAPVTEALAVGAATRMPPGLRDEVLARARTTTQLTPRATTRRNAPTQRRAVPWWSAAAAVAAVALAAAGIGWWPSDDDEGAIATDVMMVTSAPDAHSMDLGWASGHVVMSAQLDAVAVMGAGAPAPDDGMAYQAWFEMSDGTVMAGPTFAPDVDGGFMTMTYADCDDIATILITQEPRGGSAAPTSSPLARLETHPA